MKTSNEHMPNKTADFVIERDVFGQVKNLSVSVFKKLKYKPINAPELDVTYANLGVRSIATLLDLILVTGILIMAETIFFGSGYYNEKINMFRVFVGMSFWLLYNSIMESSVFQATLGEIILKIKVVDLFGKRIGFLRALFRIISTIVSILPFGYGIWYITTDTKKQSWHDLIAGTFVVRK